MSREIKFRVWDADTAEPKMVNIDPVQICDNGIWFGANYHIDDDKSCVIMQYAGMKDRNGVEIYEGDVVTDYGGKVAEVRFQTESVGSCGCCYEYFVGIGFIAIGISLHDCEVIGNRYENPELLTNES